MIRVRFAPSPTGYLHLGNIRTALFNYLFARKNGGTFILRIEDTDRERSRPEYEKALIEDLFWMGLGPDEGPEIGGPYGPYRQSERLSLYRDFAQKLIDQGKAYYCYVTEDETEAMKRQAAAEKRSFRFDNRGRFFSSREIEERKKRGIRPTVRFKIENPNLKFHDLVRGDVAFNLDEMVGDFVILRADGLPTFHLAVCVDDALMKITHVIRGEDHLSNTPKHLLLFEAMGYSPPQYAHLSLINGPGGEPLSKRFESISVRQFRRRGFLPRALANYIALLGWSPGDNREVLTWDELQQAFDLNHVSKSPSSYDPEKLDWMNGEHLRLLSDEAFSDAAMGYLKAENLLSYGEDMARAVLPVFKDKIERLEQLPERLEILRDDFAYEAAELLRSPESREVIEASLAVLPSLSGNAESLYDTFVNGVKPRVKAKGKNLFMPLRMALTGKEHGPELKRIFPALGMDKIRRRLERALGV